MKYYLRFLPLAAAALALMTSCEQEGPAERAGENIDESTEEVREEIDEAQ